MAVMRPDARAAGAAPPLPFADAALLALPSLLLVLLIGGLAGLSTGALFLLALVPGVPVGMRLFGRNHGGAYISGALLGYGLTTLAVWGARQFAPGASYAVVLGWLAAVLLPWAAFRHKARVPWLAPPPWTRNDIRALALVLLMVPLLMFRPLSRVNTIGADGSLRVRAYFTADFVWHMAVVAELQKDATPPVNPYLAPQPLHYYWGYFLVPTAATRLVDVAPDLALKVNAVGTALLLTGVLFLLGHTAYPRRPWTVAAAVLLTVVASSAEGLAALAYVYRETGGLAGVRDLNVDAVARGVGGLRIDDLPRAFWYVPQHSMSYAAGLAALAAAQAGGPSVPAAGIVANGCLLAVSALFNPFVGAIFCATYAATVCAGAWVRQRLRDVPRHLAAALPVIAALAWVTLNRMVDGAGGVLAFGFNDPARQAPVLAFLLSFGPLLLLLGPGLWPSRRLPLWPVAGVSFGVVLSIALMHLLVMTVDLFWIGFRTGHVVLVLAPPLVTRALLRLAEVNRRVVAAAVGAVVLTGVPTTAIDTFNAQDVENDHMGPGFRWTVRLSAGERAALAWVRSHTPREALVQMDPTVRGRDTWTLIPSYGERRMAAGQPISLMHEAEYDTRSARVAALFGATDARSAWKTARELGVDYVYVGREERQAYPTVPALIGPYFSTAFANDDVTILKVAQAPPVADGTTRQ